MPTSETKDKTCTNAAKQPGMALHAGGVGDTQYRVSYRISTQPHTSTLPHTESTAVYIHICIYIHTYKISEEGNQIPQYSKARGKVGSSQSLRRDNILCINSTRDYSTEETQKT